MPPWVIESIMVPLYRFRHGSHMIPPPANWMPRGLPAFRNWIWAIVDWRILMHSAWRRLWPSLAWRIEWHVLAMCSILGKIIPSIPVGFGFSKVLWIPSFADFLEISCFFFSTSTFIFGWCKLRRLSGVFLLIASMLRYFPGTEEEPVLKVLGSQDFGGPGGAWDAMPHTPCEPRQERSAILWRDDPGVEGRLEWKQTLRSSPSVKWIEMVHHEMVADQTWKFCTAGGVKTIWMVVCQWNYQSRMTLIVIKCH